MSLVSKRSSRQFSYSIRLRVDDKEIATGTLNDEETVGSSYQRLFLGGFPTSVAPPNTEIPTNVPLIGCVSDLYHNYQ